MAKKNETSELDAQDNLKMIKGIGPNYANALRAIGVDTVAKLAQYRSTADLYEDLLDNEAGVTIQLKTIENAGGDEGSWLKQARKLIEWQEKFGFMVFFDHFEGEDIELWQTRTYKTENGDVHDFPGVEPGPWVEWVFEQAGLLVDLTKEFGEETATEQSYVVESIEEPISVRIDEVELREDPRASLLDKRLIAEVSFEISGAEVTALTEQQLPFRIEIWLIEQENETGQQVTALDDRFDPDMLTYANKMDFAMPSPGRYELRTLLLLQPPYEKLISFAGPRINIIPEPVEVEPATATAVV